LLETVDPFVSFARDHVRPRGRGGADGVGSQVAACGRLKADARTRDVEHARRVLKDRRAWSMVDYSALLAAFRDDSPRISFTA